MMARCSALRQGVTHISQPARTFFEKKCVRAVTFCRYDRLHNREPKMKEIDFRQDLLPLKDKIYRVGLRITLNAQEAEDLTQDTLVRAWTRRAELAGVKNLEAFCITICRNLALDRMARAENANQPLEAAGTEACDTAPGPDERLERDEKLQRVHQIFNALPERLRTALQLRDIEGLSYAEAAGAMELTEAAFKVTLHRARKAVKTQYEKIENYGL